MQRQSIYVTYGKSDGEPLACQSCHEAIQRDDLFFIAAVQGRAFGPFCRLEDCQDRNEVRRNLSEAVANFPDIVFDVEGAVGKVMEYDKQHIGSGGD